MGARLSRKPSPTAFNQNQPELTVNQPTNLTNQMTGGVGDYIIPDVEEQPIGVQLARGTAAAVRDKWNSTTNKGQVIG
jgi:hypothetical protein